MKLLFFSLFLIFNTTGASAQDKLITRTGVISFYSKTPLENIEAYTQTAVGVLDKKKGQVEFMVLIKSFTFKKALMQEHFNENYLESDKYPKSVFKGHIMDLGIAEFSKDGKYNVSATGELTIHGITNTLNIPVTITVQEGITLVNAEFNIILADYKISIPALVKDKISETITIAVKVKYEA